MLAPCFAKRIILVLAGLNFSEMVAEAASRGFETENIVLYQTHEVMEERLEGGATLGEYVKRLQDVCQRFFATATVPETLDIVVAVRPGRRARIWFVSSVQSTPDAQRASLRKSLEEVQPFKVKAPIAFAIAGKIAGGDGTHRKDIPMPLEWHKAAKGKDNIIIPDGILDLVWPPR